MSLPSFRLAVEADVEQLLPLLREYYAYDGHRFDEQNTPGALTTLLRDPTLGRAWLIEDGRTAAGYIVLCFGYSLEWLGKDAFVDEFYLRPEYRGRGWGRKTMEYVEQAAVSLGIRALHLEVVQTNASASGIYEKLGFNSRRSNFMSKRLGDHSSKLHADSATSLRE